MEVFSLEDEDYENVFITQEPTEVVDLQPNFEISQEVDSEVQMLDMFIENSQPQYSDISDVDDCQIPSSQVTKDFSDEGINDM